MKRKHKKWLKENIFNIIFLVIILGIIGYLAFYGLGNLPETLRGMFNVNLEQEDITKLNQQPDIQCKFDISKSTACVGESVTSTITDGKNGACRIALMFNDGTGWTDWTFYRDVALDSNGRTTISDSAPVAGEYIFAAVCVDENYQMCRTNDEKITIQNCGGDCTDSDGGIDIRTPGHCEDEDGISYYDVCLDVGEGVTEFFCEDGEVKSENWMCDYGEECIATRSGGYCGDTGLDVGDIINVGTGGGIIGSGDVLSGTIPVEMSEGGNCYPGAHITTGNTESEHIDCLGAQVHWIFYDSKGLSYDWYEPMNGVSYKDFCPVAWSEQIPWTIKAELLGGKGCYAQLNWRVEVYVCECN